EKWAPVFRQGYAPLKDELSPARRFLFGRQSAVGGELIDQIGQVLAQALEQVVARHPGLRGQRIDGVGAERLGQIVRLDLLVGAFADPGLRCTALAAVLEIPDEVAEATVEHVAGAAGDQVVEARARWRSSATQQPAQDVAESAATRSLCAAGQR